MHILSAAGSPRTLTILLVVMLVTLASFAAPWSIVVAQTPPIPVSTPLASPAATAVLPTPTPVPPTPTPVLAPTPMPSPTPVISAVPETREQELAMNLVANEPGVYGYVVMEADGTLVASINGQTPFVTASLYKLLVMATVYQRIEWGSLSSSDLVPLEGRMFLEGSDNYFSMNEIGMSFSLQEYLFAVGAYSSNVAARTLLEYTSREALRNTALALGMFDTYLFTDPILIPNWPPECGPDASPEEFQVALNYLQEAGRKGPVNITTPYDMAKFQIAIANDTLLSPWVSEQMALVLQEQAIRDRIPYLLDGSVFTINKPGNLIDAVNDVGVLYLPAGPRAVSILSLAVPSTSRATYIEQQLAMIATGWAHQPVGTTRRRTHA
jgi:hypothetical protein